jgi:hypothetical protein
VDDSQQNQPECERQRMGQCESQHGTTGRMKAVSHPILQGKPNASHVCARINLHTHDRQNECKTIAVIKMYES